MPITGHQVVFTAPGEVVVEPITVSEPAADEILVQTEYSLISAGTELSNLLGQLSVFRGYPVYPGYSNVGVVTAVGSNVREPIVGQHIVSMGRHASHFKLDLSPHRQGGPQYWQVIPESVSSDKATFAVLGSVALHAVRKAALQIGEAVVVVGAGLVGQLIAQFAYWSGCQPVIMLDLYDERLEISRRLGVDFGINPQTNDPIALVQELTEGCGADAIFEGTRSAQTLPMMMKLAAQSSRIMIVGSLPGAVMIDTFTELQLREIQVIGCFQPASPQQGHAYYPWTQQRNRHIVLKMLEKGKLQVDPLITHRLPFMAAPEAYAMIQRGGGDWLGIIFEWQ
jgi:2-desacetyl-2-hydroxyethyl bacteriochlorophyllide A dehydrogenase